MCKEFTKWEIIRILKTANLLELYIDAHKLNQSLKKKKEKEREKKLLEVRIENG
ncbi:MAG: hypothetical protein ACTSX6_07570 [Candidatus Heimdallarchaeaceae archaeon]